MDASLLLLLVSISSVLREENGWEERHENVPLFRIKSVESTLSPMSSFIKKFPPVNLKVS